MNNSDIYKRAAKQLLWLFLWVVAARFSRGFSLCAMAAVGMLLAVQKKVGKSFSIFAMLAFIVTINEALMPKEGIGYTIGLRIGPLLIGLALAMVGIIKRQTYGLPMGAMVLYLFVAAFSSIGGWSIRVSFFKLLNFTAFFCAIWLGSRALERDALGVVELRATFFAVSAFIIFGSYATLPFPDISTLQGIKLAKLSSDSMPYWMVQELESSLDTSDLFCGILYHSQALGAVLSCALAWLMCDLLFVEGRLRWQHVLLIMLALPLLYKTRSRVAFLALLVSLGMIYFYLSRKVLMNVATRRWVGAFMVVFGFLIILAAIIGEVRNDSISRWLRKTENVKSDNRSLGEAVTSSRQGLMEMCLVDFRMRPLLGMGFQVAYYTQIYEQEAGGMIFSAPIEKGVWPVMILGETGIIGEVMFFIFLIYFWVKGAQKKLYLTMTLMVVFLTTNLGEATFFSPGGPGGVEWLICIIGGFSSDICLKRKLQPRFFPEWNV